jgi:hypothetical protein
LLLHRLALALHKTVGEIEATMSWSELRDWQRFEQLEPLPDRLADIHFATLIATMINLNLAADSTPASARDYFVIREVEPGLEVDDGLTEAERLSIAFRGGS